MTTNDIREKLLEKFINKDFVIDKNGGKVIELMGASFTADEPVIFGTLNEQYALKELKWYTDESLNVYDMSKPPKIWQNISDKDGNINSNYGYLIYSKENYEQYKNALRELRKNPDTRRAIMIYQRPSMHLDYNKNGMNDFVCTNTVSYFIRDNKLNAVVQMRSNDVWAGYRNDYYWQRYVLEKLTNDLREDYDISTGDIIWNAASLHLYDRQFYLLDYYNKTSKKHITKDNYAIKYPDSEYL